MGGFARDQLMSSPLRRMAAIFARLLSEGVSTLRESEILADVVQETVVGRSCLMHDRTMRSMGSI
jgi:hypothetical protein